LSDENKRKQFDTFGFTDDNMGGSAGGAGAGFHPQGFGGFGGGPGGAINLEDLFENLFGGAANGGRGGGGGRGPNVDDFFAGGGRSSSNRYSSEIHPPSDIRYGMKITFKESALGASKNIRYTRTVRCNDCNGKGFPPGTTPTSCSTCKGHGTVSH
jgi:molecular chaperone DnaJ